MSGFEAFQDRLRSDALTKETILRETTGGNTVILLPHRGEVLKFGQAVTVGEAESQTMATCLLDSAIVRVPRVHHFFYDEGQNVGYLLMEHIDGQPVDVHNNDHMQAIRKTFEHLHSIKRSFPGPLHKGEPQGILWEDSYPAQYNSIAGLQEWINQWQNSQINLMNEALVLCHLDTALQNMLWLPSGQICLLDWASAGFYPRYFETAAHLKKGQPDQAVEKLLQFPTRPFTDTEKSHMYSVLQACGNAMRYANPQPKHIFSVMPRKYLRKQPSLPQL